MVLGVPWMTMAEITFSDWFAAEATDTTPPPNRPAWKPFSFAPPHQDDKTSGLSGPVAKGPELTEVLDLALLPSGTQTVETILEAAHEAASQLPVEVLPTQDGGVTVELENEALGRELIFSIPRDGSRRFFHVASLTGHRLSGAVDLDIALENLFRWTAGKSSEISPIGLVLPRAKVKR